MDKWLKLSASLAADRKPKKKNKNLPLHLNKDEGKTDLQTKGFISMVGNTNIKKEDPFHADVKREEKRRLPFKP